MSSAYLKKNPMLYIEHLNSKSKLKKALSETLQSETTLREQNFKLFFSGANEVKLNKNYQRSQENSKSPCIRELMPSKTSYNRKRWATPKTPDMLKVCNSLKESSKNKVSEIRKTNFNIDEFIRRASALDDNKKIELMKKLVELERDL